MTDPHRDADTATARRAVPPVLWPFALLLVLTAIAEWTNLDLRLSSCFYTPVPPGYDPDLGWTLSHRAPWSYVDWLGPMPGVTLGVVATLMSLTGHFTKLWHRERDVNGFLALCVLVAPLFLVNTVFKSSWGRPRPNDVAEFGGAEAHRSVWSPGATPSRNKSFPSGHAAIGFVMMAPAFLYYRRNRSRYRRWLAAGFAYGVLMSSARIVQGAHFPTDVMWSAGLVYLSAAVLYRWIEPEHHVMVAPVAATELEPTGRIAA